jgi:hypothetical protein
MTRAYAPDEFIVDPFDLRVTSPMFLRWKIDDPAWLNQFLILGHERVPDVDLLRRLVCKLSCFREIVRP